MLLVYRLPREPSRHRVAVWRKLKALGALYLQDGVAALPEDAVTREQLEWLQLRVLEAGGEATLWEALPGTAAQRRELVGRFRVAREAAYDGLIEAAARLRRKASLAGGAGGVPDRTPLLEELGRLEREFRVERRRDYFGSPRKREAAEALRATRRVVRGDPPAAEGADEEAG